MESLRQQHSDLMLIYRRAISIIINKSFLAAELIFCSGSEAIHNHNKKQGIRVFYLRFIFSKQGI